MTDHFVTRQQANHSGMSDTRIRSGVRSGTLVRVRHGALAAADSWASLDRRTQHGARVRAAVLRSKSDTAVSHVSAAVLHGIPVLRPDFSRVHFSSNGTGGGSVAARVTHRLALDPADTMLLNGIRVTTPARTAVDVACAGSFEQAVCVIESVLRSGCTPDEIDDVLSRIGKPKGIAVARRAAEFADGTTESIGESWSRAQMAAWPDIPLPRLQHEFRTRSGLFVARTDFDWDGKLVGEFDGLVKYGDGATEAVLAERQREIRLQALGIHVIRWTWDDLRRPGALRQIVIDGLVRAGLR